MTRDARRLAVALLITFGYFHHEGGFSQNTRFDLTRAIVERGTLVIDAFHGNTQDKALHDGHYYCDKPPVVSFFGVPAYFVFARTLTLLGHDPTTPRAQSLGFWLARMTAVSSFACALVVVLSCVLAAHAPRDLTRAAAVGLGLGTLVLPYATVYYGHVVAAALLFGAFAVLLDERRGRGFAAALVAAGIAGGTAVAAEYQTALVLTLLVLYTLTGPRPLRTAAWFVAGAAVPIAGLMAYHAAVFGGPLTTGFVHEALPYWQEKYGTGLYGLHPPQLDALYELTVGPQRGLFRQAPWLLLAVPGIWALGRRGWWAEAMLVGATFGVMLGLNASLHSWEGGWTMGARYLVPAVPFLAFAAGFASGRWARIVAALTIPPSVFFMLTGAAVMPEVPVFVTDPLRQFLLPWFVSGRLSVANPGGRSWNAGELLGLHGLWSLVPLAAVWGVWGVVAFRARR